MPEATNYDLKSQLVATRESVEQLSKAVEHLSAAVQRNKFWTLALWLIAGSVFMLAIIGYIDSKNQDHELRELGRNLFIVSCEATNDSRTLQRQSNLLEAEALITVTRSDELRPEIADDYREQIRQLNASMPDRDCRQEFEDLQ